MKIAIVHGIKKNSVVDLGYYYYHYLWFFFKGKVGEFFWWFPHRKLLPLNPKLNNKRDKVLLIISLKVFKVLKIYALELYVVSSNCCYMFLIRVFFSICDAQLFMKGAKEKDKNKGKNYNYRKKNDERGYKMYRTWIKAWGSHISKKKLRKNHVQVFMVQVGLHYEQRPLNHGPWVFSWSHSKSNVPWVSIGHGQSSLV